MKAPLGEEMTEALTPRVEARIRRLGKVDLIVGIPAYNCADTIGYVMNNAAQGLLEFFPEERGLLLISDGGSTDGTRDVASELRLPPGVERIVGTYAGAAGKGSAVKLVFEAARLLGAVGVALVDSDLRSIVPEWIRLLLEPVLKDAGLSTPLYMRHKYDGTITNHIAYPLTRTLYGKRIRQPIGGEFGLSKELVERLLASPLWENPYTPRFGIDAFITHTALALGFPVVEASLGVKIHSPKEPTKHLAPMFREVVGSLFSAMVLYESSWREIHKSEPVPLLRGHFKPSKPEECSLDREASVRAFKEGFPRFRGLYRSILTRDLYDELSTLVRGAEAEFTFSTELWAKTAYTFAAGFKEERRQQKRDLLLDALRICWYGRIGAFTRETRDLDDKEADEKVLDAAIVFETLKDYLLEIY